MNEMIKQPDSSRQLLLLLALLVGIGSLSGCALRLDPQPMNSNSSAPTGSNQPAQGRIVIGNNSVMTWSNLYKIAEEPGQHLHELIVAGYEQTHEKFEQRFSKGARPGMNVHLRLRECSGMPIRFITEEYQSPNNSGGGERLIGIEVAIPEYIVYLHKHGQPIPVALLEEPRKYLKHCSRPDGIFIDDEGNGSLLWARQEYGKDNLSAFVRMIYAKEKMLRFIYGTSYTN